MSNNRSKSTENRTISKFDRGREQLTNHFSNINKNEVIYIQLLFFVILEVLSLKLTNNDPESSSNVFKILFHCLQKANMLPNSMISTGKSIRQSQIFHDHVRTFQNIIQGTLNIIQKSSTTTTTTTTTTSVPTNALALTNIIEKEYPKVILKTPLSPPPSSLSIDIPHPDLQLKVPLPLTFNGTLMSNGFDNVVIYRYVTDFRELNKLGRGAFGSVFRAKNRLDDRMYAIKKIIFNENTDRTRRQANCALREVRILASLCHPNIVQYHCAWLELVPTNVHQHRHQIPSPSSPKIEEQDSVDRIIQFEEQSQSINQNTQTADKSQKSSTSQEDESELSVSESNGEFYSDDDRSSLSKSASQQQTSPTPNNQLVPYRSSTQPIFNTSKLVLFIQMQLCDTTLYDWLRYRDQSIIEQTSDERRISFYMLDDFRQKECRNIFEQILQAVDYLHSQSFVHRDIKPRNIFLTKDLKDPSAVIVKLGDFGLATLLDSQTHHDTADVFGYDEESSGVGTVLYAPPEQLNSHHCIATDKSDSYSLGIVLFELFNIFATEMERHRCLSDLRVQMKVQDEFGEAYPFESKIIEQLILIDREQRLGVNELLRIYSKEIQLRFRSQKYSSKQKFIEQLQQNLYDKDKKIEQLENELGKVKS